MTEEGRVNIHFGFIDVAHVGQTMDPSTHLMQCLFPTSLWPSKLATSQLHVGQSTYGVHKWTTTLGWYQTKQTVHSSSGEIGSGTEFMMCPTVGQLASVHIMGPILLACTSAIRGPVGTVAYHISGLRDS